MQYIAVTLALVGCLTSASAQTTASFGVSDCGQWLANKSPNRRAWLLGYLTGFNRAHTLAGQKPLDPLDALNSAEQAYVWMDNWCRSNPLKTVEEGGLALFIELMKKKQ